MSDLEEFSQALDELKKELREVAPFKWAIWLVTYKPRLASALALLGKCFIIWVLYLTLANMLSWWLL